MSLQKLNDLANKPNELLDLVDENDQIIGEVIRKDANADPKLIHREIGVIIVDDQNRILFEKRSKYKKVGPGVWSIPAGHVLKGEGIEVTAHQELLEEIGFDLDLTYLGKKLRRYKNESHFTNYFLGKYSGQKIKIEPAEVEKARFFSKKDIEIAEKSGEVFNHNHFDMFEQVLSGAKFL